MRLLIQSHVPSAVFNRTMRIVIIGQFGLESLGRHIAETFSKMGHEVGRCDPLVDVSLGWFDVPALPAFAKKIRRFAVAEVLARESYAKSLVRRLKTIVGGGKCDLILATHDFLSPLALHMLRREFSAKLVLWFPDHVARLGKSFMLSGLYDFIFFKDPFLVDRFRRELGLSGTHYLPECCNAEKHTINNLLDVAETRDLGTAGNIHPARAAVLQRLVSEGHRVTVWGPPVSAWMADRLQNIESLPFVGDHEKVRAFRSCKIVLNTTYPAEIDGTNVRTFEAAAAGAFQLVNDRSALAELFDTEKEIIAYRSLDDLVDKVKYYLPRDNERREIAERAQKRALAEHTYEKRLTTILGMLD